MSVRFSEEAQKHIAGIYTYLYIRNAAVALAVVLRIKAAAALLGEFPLLGREGSDKGTKELAVKGLPFIIVYEIKKRKQGVVVLAVFHGARER